MNRMASANFLAPQIQEFESTLNTLASSRLGAAITTSLLGDEATAKYAAGMVAPSDIVDLINQMSGATRVRSLAEIASEKGLAPDSIEYLRTKAAYQAIAKFVESEIPVTADTLHQFSIKPSAIARASLEQQGRILGRQRALGIALGVAAEDLPGFDPLILQTGGRLGVDDDIINLRNSMVEEYSDVASTLRAAGATAVDLDTLESEMEALRKADLATIRTILSLSEKRIKEYGSLSAARRLGTAGLSELEALTPKAARSTIAQLRALSDPRYAEEARGFLRSKKIRDLFEQVKNLENEIVIKGKPERLLKVQASQLKSELGEELSKGLRIVEEIHRGSGANVLDIVETFEAEMQSAFGARAGRFLEYMGQEGEEDLMIQLQMLSKKRRNLRLSSFDPRGRSIVSGYYNTFRDVIRGNTEALDALGGSISDDLMKVSANEAKRILRYNEEQARSRGFKDFR